MRWQPDPDEALFAIAILARDADGVIHPDETRFIAGNLGDERRRLGLEGEMAAVAMLARSLRENGLDGTLDLLGAAFGDPSAQRAAVRFALQVALADRDLDSREVEHVRRMGQHFGLPESELQAILAG